MTIWVSTKLALALHDEQLREHGGGTGLRDRGLLESALARPVNRAGYGEPDIAELAAVYAFGIAKNHAFIDGNKRTAFAVLTTFVALNGVAFEPSEADAVMTMLKLAAGEMDEEAVTAWVRSHASVTA